MNSFLLNLQEYIFLGKTDECTSLGKTSICSATAIPFIDSQKYADCIFTSLSTSGIFDGLNGELLLLLQNRTENNLLESIKSLIENGADVNVIDEDKNTPLLLLLKNQRENVLEMFTLLIEHGANINVINEDKYTPLLLLLKYQRENVLEMFTLLIEHSANINVIDKDNSTPLLLLLKNQKENVLVMCKSLIEHGANLNVFNNHISKTPISIILKYYHKQDLLEICKLLLENGASVDNKSFDKYGNEINYDDDDKEPEYRDSDSSLLLLLLFNYHTYRVLEIFELLIEHGANINYNALLEKRILHFLIDYNSRNNELFKETNIIKKKILFKLILKDMDYKKIKDISMNRSVSSNGVSLCREIYETILHIETIANLWNNKISNGETFSFGPSIVILENLCYIGDSSLYKDLITYFYNKIIQK